MSTTSVINLVVVFWAIALPLLAHLARQRKTDDWE